MPQAFGRINSAILLYDELQHTHTREQMIQEFVTQLQLSERDAQAYFFHIHLRRTDPNIKYF